MIHETCTRASPCTESDAPPGLFCEQAQVYRRVVDASGGDVVVLRGYAGTGKSFVASRIIEKYLDMAQESSRGALGPEAASGMAPLSQSGVLVLAPTAAALLALRSKFENTSLKTSDYKTLASVFTDAVPYVKVTRKRTELLRAHLRTTVGRLGTATDPMVGFMKRLQAMGVSDPSSYVIAPKRPKNAPDTRTVEYVVDDVGLSQVLKATVESTAEFVKRDAEAVASRIDESQLSLIVVDEYSMVNQGTHQQLMDALMVMQQEGMTMPVVLLCGDPGQLPPVVTAQDQLTAQAAAASRINVAMRAPADGVDIFELTQIRRQAADSDIPVLAQLVRQGVSLAALAQSSCPWVCWAPQDVSAIMEHYGAYIVAADKVLTFRNETCRAINSAKRAAVGVTGNHYQPGEPLVVTRNVSTGFGFAWANGELVEIEHYVDTTTYLAVIHETLSTLRDSQSERAQFFAIHRDKYSTSRGYYRALDEALEMLSTTVANVATCLKSGWFSVVKLRGTAKNSHREGYAFVATDYTREGQRVPLNVFKAQSALRSRNISRMWRVVETVTRRDPVSHELVSEPLSVVRAVHYVQVKLAYAMTVHKAQGSEMGSVVYLVSGQDLAIQARSDEEGVSWRAAYTAITRATDQVMVLYSQ